MFHRVWRYRLRTERAELRYLLGRQFDGGSVFDIGAHRGVYTYWMHRRFRSSRVVAFEPQAELVGFLTDLKRTFCLDRMQIAPIGLSSRSGKLPMHRPRLHWGAATVDEFTFGDRETDTFEVPVTTIDNFVTENPELRPVRFIKCDVEYHETEVFAGAERVLSEDRPELLVEWSTPRRGYREKLFRQLKRLDYAAFQFEYGRLAPCNSPERQSPPSWELGANYVFLPREMAASAAA
jgi:FkbM family methyltransferase